tara:strand:- start:551 stop:1888 length:1338 start_codon:yes stop_codon:yes gene_type:complete
MAPMLQVFSQHIYVKRILGYVAGFPLDSTVEVVGQYKAETVHQTMDLIVQLGTTNKSKSQCMKSLSRLGIEWWNTYDRGHSSTYIGDDNQIKMIPGFCDCWGVSTDSIDETTLDILQAVERNYHSVTLSDKRVVDCSVEQLPIGLSFIHWVQRLAWKHIEDIPFGLYGHNSGWWTKHMNDFPLQMHKSPTDLFDYDPDPTAYKSNRDDIKYKKAITTYLPRVWGYEADEGHNDLDDCKVIYSPASLMAYRVVMPKNDSVMDAAMNYADQFWLNSFTEYERAKSIFGCEWRLLKDAPTVAVNMSKGSLPSHYRECIPKFHGDDYFTSARANSGIYLAYVTRSEAWYRQLCPKAIYRKVSNVQARFGNYYGAEPLPATKKRLLGYLIPDYYDSFDDFIQKLGVTAALGMELIQWMGTHVRYICREDIEVDERLRDSRTATDWILTLV